MEPRCLECRELVPDGRAGEPLNCEPCLTISYPRDVTMPDGTLQTFYLETVKDGVRTCYGMCNNPSCIGNKAYLRPGSNKTFHVKCPECGDTMRVGFNLT